MWAAPHAGWLCRRCGRHCPPSRCQRRRCGSVRRLRGVTCAEPPAQRGALYLNPNRAGRDVVRLAIVGLELRADVGRHAGEGGAGWGAAERAAAAVAAAALGAAARLAALLAALLDVPLRYPIRFGGSRSCVLEHPPPAARHTCAAPPRRCPRPCGREGQAPPRARRAMDPAATASVGSLSGGAGARRLWEDEAGSDNGASGFAVPRLPRARGAGGALEFPLYCHGAETVSFAYAVFLLNKARSEEPAQAACSGCLAPAAGFMRVSPAAPRAACGASAAPADAGRAAQDVEQLLHAHGLSAVGAHQLLPNLHKLLAAAASAAPVAASTLSS